MRRLLRPTVVVSGLAFGGQLVSLALQVLVASLFGARAEMDAYLAAFALPAYVSAVLTGGLGYVFVPLFVDARIRLNEREAWRVASTLITVYVLAVGSISVAGIWLAQPLLRLTVPGLPEPTLVLATRLARILWPSVLLGGLVALWSGLYQAYERFTWPALSPVAGALVILGVVAAFGRREGISALAVGTLFGSVAQTLLLVPILRGRFRPVMGMNDDRVREAFYLVLPLMLGALASQASRLIDRYVGSSLPMGSIAYLGYGEKITTLAATVLSGGIATTLFPALARQSSASDATGLYNTMASGIRFTWLVVAPAVALGVALASPLVGSFLQRGAFRAEDTQAVASVLPWYLCALIGMTWGNMTARTFYALKDTRTMSFIAVVEVALYAVYTPWLAHQFGVLGVAYAVGFYWNASLLAQCILLWFRLGRPSLERDAQAVASMGLCAGTAGAAAYLSSIVTPGPPFAVLGVGTAVGLSTYLLGLHVLKIGEWRRLLNLARKAP